MEENKIIKTSNEYYQRTAYAKNHYMKWELWECQMLIYLREQGYTFYEIAKTLDRSEASCYMKLARLQGRAKN